jgi:hypothetical protein
MHKNSEAPLSGALCTATSAMISSRFAMNSAHTEGCVYSPFLTLIDVLVNHGWGAPHIALLGFTVAPGGCRLMECSLPQRQLPIPRPTGPPPALDTAVSADFRGPVALDRSMTKIFAKSGDFRA